MKTKVLCLLASTFLVLLSPAHAAYPGENGLISLFRGNELWVVRPDGTGLRNLTKDIDQRVGIASWSPDGTQLAVGCGGNGGTYEGQICVMDADGTNLRRITDLPGGNVDPDWSQDGKWIAFRHSARHNGGIWRVSVDGGTVRRVDERNGIYPAWGTSDRIVFSGEAEGGSGIVTVNPDGSDRKLVVKETRRFGTQTPDWSPDGQRIVFIGYEINGENLGSPMICTVRADGTDRNCTDRQGTDPAWSPSGRRILYKDAEDVMTMKLDGTGRHRVLEGGFFFPDWQPR